MTERPDGTTDGAAEAAVAAGASQGAGPETEADLADDGPPKGRRAPRERMCLVSRAAMPVEALVRFVVDPDGRVVPDIRRTLPGRGVWVTATAAVVAEAERRRLFARGFKAQVTVEPGLAGRVETLLAKAALEALSMARKAGLVVTGFMKVETAIGSATLAALVEAADGAEDGRRKIRAALMRRHGRVDAVPVITAFRSAEIGLALGLTNVIHAAVLAGRAGDGFVDRAGALARFRGVVADNAATAGDAGS